MVDEIQNARRGTEVVSSDRIDQIEKVLEKVAIRLDQLVALEVNHAHTKDTVAEVKEDVDDLKKDVHQLSLKLQTSAMITSGVERLGWLLVSALIGLGVYFLR